MPKKPKYYVRPDGLHESIRNIDGKRVAFRGKTDAEVERKMIEYRARAAQGRLFKDVAEEWKSVHFPTLAPNTLKGYRPALKDASEHFGDDYIKQIDPPDIKAYIGEFAAKKCAKKTVTNRLLVLSLIFSYAVQNGDILYSPCTHISIPKNLTKTRREAASAEDESKIKNSAPDSWLLPFMILYTGLRKGEALALTYGDIDRNEKIIHVTKSVYHENNKPKIKQPKTEAGFRTVPILDPLIKRLPRGKPEEYVFSLDGGKTALSEMQYQKQWENYASSINISCTAHQLRHSYATMLFEFGIALKDAQDLLGHSTAAMTQDIYTHLRDTHKKETVKLINQKLQSAEIKSSKSKKQSKNTLQTQSDTQ